LAELMTALMSAGAEGTVGKMKTYQCQAQTSENSLMKIVVFDSAHFQLIAMMSTESHTHKVT